MKTCKTCKSTELANKNFCESCRQRRNAYYRQRYAAKPSVQMRAYEREEALRQSGKCIRCKQEGLETKNHCADCAEIMRQRQRNRTKRLLDSGLCMECGKRPLKTKHRCEVCRQSKNESQNYAYRKGGEAVKQNTWQEKRASMLENVPHISANALTAKPADITAMADHIMELRRSICLLREISGDVVLTSPKDGEVTVGEWCGRVLGEELK